jgi:hypothetical protein
MTGDRVLIGILAALALLNARVTVRLWRHPLFERGQKVAQTVLLWIVPGMFLVVGHLVGPARSRRLGATADPTIGDAFNTDVGSLSQFGDGHGHGGSDHGGGDFGGGVH